MSGYTEDGADRDRHRPDETPDTGIHIDPALDRPEAPEPTWREWTETVPLDEFEPASPTRADDQPPHDPPVQLLGAALINDDGIDMTPVMIFPDWWPSLAPDHDES